MKSENIDWSVIRMSVIVFSVTLTIGLGLILSSHFFIQAQQSNFESTKRQFNSISGRYLSIDEEEKLVKEFYPEFLREYEQGIIGPEKRLDWIESLRHISDDLKLISLRYDIASQAEYRQAMPLNLGRFRLYASIMRLNVELLHEEDLLRLLAEIDARLSGLNSTSDCQIVRQSKSIADDSINRNLTAECNLVWYNLKRDDGQEIVLS
ncbi:MAG: hypothetical protein WDZ86_05540 [Gammaproteobacteria bacterium]